ncbi:MAG TPA: TolC family protein [Alicycliphilus sp.]|jgi:cobalt-zinc-cadmium efflux system outer membrane protein|nr:TolC family protein [Alicycliphilus denitrificans]MBP7326727.1 TolC family protein [Alicycliphilus sp.]MBP7330434.1 TolC family protein [Alicycliphilus sp.]HPU20858.1 TolC family protein [Alicycliphilus sp.]HRN64728.1 TolC family protein [Alicycliphilus sp.]HRO51769.1 TolC family protein [Alicycliphilus sp.]
MLISSSGAPGERRPAPGHGVLRAIPRRTWIHRLSILSIALAGSMFAASRTYALSFAEAREIAEQQSPRVSAQRLQIDAVESAQKAAGTLPDPKLSVGLENLPISGMDRWSLTRESMTGQRLALMQEVPNQAKRAAKVASAQARVERERAALVLQRLQIRQELGLAWIAAQAVEQREQLLTELLAENQRLQDSLPARVAGGSAQAGDLLAAQQEALALSDRRDDLQRDRSKARAMLRRWVGPRADESLQGGTGPLIHPVAQLRAELSSHAELALYPTMQSMARAESHEAQSESRGDWSWEIAYSRRDRRWGDMVSFQVTFDLPWQKDRRQTPMIQAKQRELERLEAEQEDVARRHLQELDDSAAELQALDSQIERLKSTGLQLAQGRAELALGNYRAAKGDLGAVLGARAQVLETRLRLIDLQAQRDGVTTRLNSLIAD